MKRRDFLKILGAVPVVSAMPALAKPDKPNLYVSIEDIANARDILNTQSNPSEDSFLSSMNKAIARTGEIMADNSQGIWPKSKQDKKKDEQ